jgi:hypothetical protein
MPGLALTVATPWIVVTLPTVISIHRSASPSPGRAESVVLVPANSTNKSDESAIHSMKEKQQ